jgi:hypothetical protein
VKSNKVRNFKHTNLATENDDSLSKNVGPHKKLSIDKQLELSGEKHRMSPGHSIFLKDRDGYDIHDEVRKLKQHLIRNVFDQNQMVYNFRDS